MGVREAPPVAELFFWRIQRAAEFFVKRLASSAQTARYAGVAQTVFTTFFTGTDDPNVALLAHSDHRGAAIFWSLLE